MASAAAFPKVKLLQETNVKHDQDNQLPEVWEMTCVNDVLLLTDKENRAIKAYDINDLSQMIAEPLVKKITQSDHKITHSAPHGISLFRENVAVCTYPGDKLIAFIEIINIDQSQSYTSTEDSSERSVPTRDLGLNQGQYLEVRNPSIVSSSEDSHSQSSETLRKEISIAPEETHNKESGNLRESDHFMSVDDDQCSDQSEASKMEHGNVAGGKVGVSFKKRLEFNGHEFQTQRRYQAVFKLDDKYLLAGTSGAKKNKDGVVHILTWTGKMIREVGRGEFTTPFHIAVSTGYVFVSDTGENALIAIKRCPNQNLPLGQISRIPYKAAKKLLRGVASEDNLLTQTQASSSYVYICSEAEDCVYVHSCRDIEENTASDHIFRMISRHQTSSPMAVYCQGNKMAVVERGGALKVFEIIQRP